MDHNFILCLLITFIVLYLIKECFTIHMGPICAYDNTLYFVLLIAVLLLVAIGRSVNIIEFNLPGILLGIVCFLASYIISYVSYRLYDKSNEREYREKRKLVIEDINVDALKEVMKECEESGVDISKKQCNCACKFSDRNPSKEQCLEDTLPTPDKCCPIFGCESAYLIPKSKNIHPGLILGQSGEGKIFTKTDSHYFQKQKKYVLYFGSPAYSMKCLGEEDPLFL